MIPATNFYEYFRNNIAIVLNRTIYVIGIERDAPDFMDWNGSRFSLTPGERLSKLEELYFERIENMSLDKENGVKEEHILIAKKLLGLGEERISRAGIIDNVFPEGCFLAYLGRFFNLKNSHRGNISINNQRYSIGEKAFALEEKEILYKKEITRSGLKQQDYSLEQLVKKGYYNKNRNFGLEIHEGEIYAFTNVEPYVLYDKHTGNNFLFAEAKVATKLNLDGQKVRWGPLVVINPYTHPAIPQKNKAFQKICMGKFDYDSIRRRYNDPRKQILAALYRGRQALTRGYYGESGAWKRLRDEDFAQMQVRNFRKELVTNI
jgi:hypothetical protein